MAAERGSPALLLGLAALLATALLAGIHHVTRERIAAREHARALERLAAVLPPALYDNDPLADTTVIHDARLGPGPRTVWRARRAGTGTAVALAVTAPDGYAGPIELLVGIDRGGRVLGVRVASHAETPGLGDPIELRRSDWILSFDGRSLADPLPARWSVRRDGGDFDQFTGATITPRAVVAAVARALAVHGERGDALYAPP